MKQFLRDCFTFNRRERSGILVLLCILALLFFALAYMHSGEFVRSEDKGFEENILDTGGHQQFTGKAITRAGSDKATFDREEKTAAEDKTKRVPQCFYFNPNELDQSGWEKLGLSEKLTKTILNYVSKGGKFRKKEDLKKIYGLRDEDFRRLENYIRIPEDSVRKTAYTAYTGNPNKVVKDQMPVRVSNKIQPGHHLELNSADSTELLMLPCVGPAFAKRILAYRSRIGGFVSTEQLKEIFGFDEERFSCLSDRVEVDLSKIHKLNINTATADELKKHPYIRWNVAKLIESYRKQHGPYHHLEELKNLALMDEALYTRMSPYLTLQ